jgi:hypothetical protein
MSASQHLPGMTLKNHVMIAEIRKRDFSNGKQDYQSLNGDVWFEIGLTALTGYTRLTDSTLQQEIQPE